MMRYCKIQEDSRGNSPEIGTCLVAAVAVGDAVAAEALLEGVAHRPGLAPAHRAAALRTTRGGLSFGAEHALLIKKVWACY